MQCIIIIIIMLLHMYNVMYTHSLTHTHTCALLCQVRLQVASIETENILPSRKIILDRSHCTNPKYYYESNSGTPGTHPHLLYCYQTDMYMYMYM